MAEREAFHDFHKKRMEIFRELVRYIWQDNLTIESLDKLAADIKEKYSFREEDIPFIKDHIRVAMGLAPNQRAFFSDELAELKRQERIEGPVLARIEGACKECGERFEGSECHEACKYEAQMYVKGTGPIIIEEKCLNCGRCTVACSFGALADKIEFIPLVKLLKGEESMVFAAAAPSIAGQFGEDVSVAQLRTAFKLMGFADMVEVALFADILDHKGGL